MSACPEILLGCLSGSVGLGVMPPALALAPVPLVHEVVDDGRRPNSHLQRLLRWWLPKVESSTIPSVMLSQPGLGLSCHQLLPPSLRNSWTGLARVNLWT